MDQQADIAEVGLTDRKADFQAVHAQAMDAFADAYEGEDDGEDDADAKPWSSQEIADLVLKGHNDQDALAIRVLAGRIAAGPSPQCSAPGLELLDFGRALSAVAAATVSIIAVWKDPEDWEPEEFDEYRKTVQSLIAAARGLDELAGWF